MNDLKSTGRLIGVLLIVQMTIGIIVNSVLLPVAITAPPGFLENAAAHATRVGLATVLGLTGGVLSVAIGVAALQAFRRFSPGMALGFFSFSVVGLALTAIEHAAVMSMLSLSEAYVRGGDAQAGTFEGARTIAAAARNWAHFTHILLGGVGMFVFYAVLYRFRLIPRALAAVGLLAIALQIGTVSMHFFGERIVMLMLAPIGIVHVAVSLWLALRGFEERSPATRPATLGVQHP
jgi:hypothetical protein